MLVDVGVLDGIGVLLDVGVNELVDVGVLDGVGSGVLVSVGVGVRLAVGEGEVPLSETTTYNHLELRAPALSTTLARTK